MPWVKRKHHQLIREESPKLNSDFGVAELEKHRRLDRMNNRGGGDPRDTHINLSSRPATNADDASEPEKDAGRATSDEATAMVAQEYFKNIVRNTLISMNRRNLADVADLTPLTIFLPRRAANTCLLVEL